MKLKDLVKKLEDKSPQNEEVQFVVWTKAGMIVCAEMNGPMTTDLVRLFAKHAPKAVSSPNIAGQPRRSEA